MMMMTMIRQAMHRRDRDSQSIAWSRALRLYLVRFQWHSSYLLL